MATLKSERDSLQARLDDLAAARGKLQAEIDDLGREADQVMYALAVLERIEVDDEPAPRRVRRMGATTEYVVRALAKIGRGAEVDEVLGVMRHEGWSAQPDNPIETVRAALSRAVRDGLAIRSAYGVYELPPQAEFGDEEESADDDYVDEDGSTYTPPDDPWGPAPSKDIPF